MAKVNSAIVNNIGRGIQKNCTYHEESDILLCRGDNVDIMQGIDDSSIDLVFADPPYFLSNGGISCSGGKIVSVNKAHWDESAGVTQDEEYHRRWIQECHRVLKPDGSIWISGTYHSIYTCGYLLVRSGYEIINDIAWYKPNAAPNMSCRCFTASHETLLWARKKGKGRHHFAYSEMKEGFYPEDALKKEGKQMRSVWSIPVTGQGEKVHGRHPTQKPVALLTRIIRASTEPGDVVLDPFNGSGTTGVAVKRLGGRKYIGIDVSEEYLSITKKRLENERHR